MSAIAGVFHFDGAGPAMEQVKRMTTHMQQRGPDGISHWSGPGIALGYCQLCTTPESLHEKQPLQNESGTAVLVFAGRVDNRQDLRTDLLSHGCMLRDDTDAELVLKAWEIWRDDAPDRIIGDFAYFVWDVQQRTLFGARDVAGNRALYYACGDGWFAFASETRALIASGLVQPHFNEFSILDFISVEYDRFDEKATLFRDISKLPLGHGITVKPGAVRTMRYWFPENNPGLVFSSRDEFNEAFMGVFRESVSCRLRATGPVGACLSGGMDSSSIVGLISKEFSESFSSPLRTYSLIDADRDNCLDWPYIQSMQGCSNIESTVIASDLTNEECRALLEEMNLSDSPHETGDRLTDLIIARRAEKDGCKVLLDGMAGDYLFLTPEHSLEYIFRLRLFHLLPDVIRAHYRHNLPGVWSDILKKTMRPLVPIKLLEKYRSRLDQQRSRTAREEGNNMQFIPAAMADPWLESRSKLLKHWEHARGNDAQKTAEQLWLLSPMVSFAYECKDALSGRHRIEQRGPFSDRRMMEFAIAMPLEAKLSRGSFKNTLRENMADILPARILARKTLGGHPGWKFAEQLARYCAANNPDLLAKPLHDNRYSYLVNAPMLSRLLGDYSGSSAKDDGEDLLRLAVLFEWIHTVEKEHQPD